MGVCDRDRWSSRRFPASQGLVTDLTVGPESVGDRTADFRTISN